MRPARKTALVRLGANAVECGQGMRSQVGLQKYACGVYVLLSNRSVTGNGRGTRVGR